MMYRRILKLAFLNAIQRRHIKQHQKNIEVFEQAFATIKSTTGISEIEEIVRADDCSRVMAFRSGFGCFSVAPPPASPRSSLDAGLYLKTLLALSTSIPGSRTSIP